MKTKIDMEISPATLTVDYDRGLDLKFTADKSDVLDHFEVADIVLHFDNDDLLDAMDPDVVRDWVDRQ